MTRRAGDDTLAPCRSGARHGYPKSRSMMRLVFGVSATLMLLILLIPVVTLVGALFGFMVAAGLR